MIPEDWDKTAYKTKIHVKYYQADTTVSDIRNM